MAGATGCQPADRWPIPPALKETARKGGLLTELAGYEFVVPLYLPAGSQVQFMDVESGIRENQLQVTLVLGTPMEPSGVARVMADHLSATAQMVSDDPTTTVKAPPIKMIFKRGENEPVGLSVRIGKAPREFEPERLQLSASGEETKIVLAGWLAEQGE